MSSFQSQRWRLQGILSDQPSETQRYSVDYHRKPKKTLNIEIWDAGITDFKAVLIRKWLFNETFGSWLISCGWTSCLSSVFQLFISKSSEARSCCSGVTHTVLSAVDACIHMPAGSICVCVDVRVDGEESIWRSMQAAVLSTLQTLLCCWCINAPTGLAQGDQRLMRQPSHKRTRQTHEYWYGSGERWRQGVFTRSTAASIN